MPTTIEHPKSDDELPEETLKEISKMLSLGYEREHLLISESGHVIIDNEACSYERLMKRMHPERPRNEYMYVVYPSKIIVE